MPPQYHQFPPQVLQPGAPITHHGPGPPLVHPQQILGYQQQQQFALFKQQQQHQQPQQTSPQELLRQQNQQWAGYRQPFVKTEQVPMISPPNGHAIVIDNRTGAQYLIDASTAALGPFPNWNAATFFQYPENNGGVTKPDVTKSEVPKVSPKPLSNNISSIKQENGGRVTIGKVEHQLQLQNNLDHKETKPIGVHIKEELVNVPTTVKIETKPNIKKLENVTL